MKLMSDVDSLFGVFADLLPPFADRASDYEAPEVSGSILVWNSRVVMWCPAT